MYLTVEAVHIVYLNMYTNFAKFAKLLTNTHVHVHCMYYYQVIYVPVIRCWADNMIKHQIMVLNLA